MSEILCEWLNEDVRLTRHVEAFEEDFSNGYLFGEIFHHYGIQADFSLFKSGTGPDAMVANWARLEQSFRRVNMPLNTKVCNDVMNRKRGAAANLLLQLRIRLEKIRASVPGLARQHVGTAGVLPPVATATRPAYESMQRRFYEHNLRRSSPRAIDVNLAMLERKFVEHMHAMQASAARSEESERQQSEYEREVRRQTQRELLRTQKRHQEQLDASGQRSHALNMAVFRDIEQAQLAFELTQQRRAENQAQASRLSATVEVKDGIAVFEANLARLNAGADAISSASDATAPGASAAAAPPLHSDFRDLDDEERDSPLATLRRIKARAPPMAEMHKQTDKYMSEVKRRKAADAIARKEREKRRRQMLLDQARLQSEMEEQRKHEWLAAKLVKQSQEEREREEKLQEYQQQKEVIRQNRLFREQQYRERRAKDYAAALKRDAELGKVARAKYHRQLAVEAGQRAELQAAQQQARFNKHYAMCANILDGMLDVAEKAYEYRERTQQDLIPENEMREWRRLFVAGIPLSRTLQGTDVLLRDMDGLTDEERRVLDEQAVEDYVSGSGEWSEMTQPLPTSKDEPRGRSRISGSRPGAGSPDSSGATQAQNPALAAQEPGAMNNPIVGQMLIDLEARVAPPPPPSPVLQLPSVPLCVAVIGKPMAGKTSVASLLADKYHAQVLSVDRVIQQALETAEETRASQEPEDTALVPLLDAAEADLSAGRSVDDAVAAALVANAVVRATADPKCGGCVLDGYPMTQAQAALLERHLSGYEDPAVVEPVVAKPSSGKGAKGRKSKLAAPLPEPEKAIEVQKGGIDIVLHLDIEDDIAVRRSAGIFVDPETSKQYHVDDAPASAEDLATARLQPVSQASEQLQSILLAQATAMPNMLAWLTPRFANVSTVVATAGEDVVAQAAVELVDACIADKEAAAEAAAAAKAEADASQQQQQQGEDGAAEADAEPTEGKDVASTTSDASASSESGGALAVQDSPAAKPIDVSLAKVILHQWRCMETCYVNQLKRTFSGLRRVRFGSVEHGEQTRRAFSEFMRQPDTENTLIWEFQREFDSVADELRSDADGKAELHQRASELQDRLWELVEQRRDNGEAERCAIIDSGWIEDCLSRMIHHFTTLLSLEAERYTSTLHVLHDYYAARDDKPLPSTASTSVPLLSSAARAATPATTSAPSPGAVSGKKSAAVKAGIPRRDSRNRLDSAASSASSRKVSDAAGSGKAGGKAGGADARLGKGKRRGSAAGKNGAVLALATPPTARRDEARPSTIVYEYATPIEEAVTAARALLMQAPAVDADSSTLFQELCAAWQHENDVYARRINAISLHAKEMLREAKSRGEALYRHLDTCITERFEGEMRSIAGLMHVVRTSIEAESRLLSLLVLEDCDVVIDEQHVTLPPEPEPEVLPPRESVEPPRWTCEQVVRALCDPMRRLAPSGFVSLAVLTEHFATLQAETQDDQVIPAAWASLSLAQLTQVLCLFDPLGLGYVNWHEVALALLPLPFPELQHLLALRVALEAVDQDNTGVVPRDAWSDIPMWPGSRTGGVREGSVSAVLQAVFQDESGNVPYSDMLMLLCYAPPGTDPTGLDRGFVILSSNGEIPSTTAASNSISQTELAHLLRVVNQEADTLQLPSCIWSALGKGADDHVTVEQIRSCSEASSVFSAGKIYVRKLVYDKVARILASEAAAASQ